jgi:two-component system, sensor histidine kinase PdtaS
LLYALNLATKNGLLKLYDIYFLLSVVNRYKANFDKSLLYATKCIDNAHELNATALDTFYGELALVYEELGRPEESSVWYRRALDRRKQYKTDRLYIFRTAGFLIRQLIRQNKAGQGLALIDSLTKDYPPQTVLEKATVAQNRAYCFDALKQYTKAEEHFQEMMVNYEKTAYRDEFICIANMDMGKFYLKRQQYNKAQTYLSAALSVAYANPLSDRGEIYQLLFTADSATGNYRAAIEDLQQYKIVNDSVFNDKNTKQIKELEIQYETHKKEQNILLLEKESRLQQTRLNQASITRNWMLAGAALMMIIIILLVSYLGLKQRTTRKLRLQQKEIEKKNTALENLVKEKEWLVKEIHHRVKNNFHIVQVLLGTQSGYLKSEESINALADSQHRVQAMALIHQKLYQSENLSAIRMSAYIHELVDYLKESFNIRQEIQFRLQIDPIELGLSHVIPLGLILNEAITNSIKYAFPDNKEAIITISLQRSFNNHCILTISDNGIGLPARLDIANPVSMGMRLMQGLTEDLEGNFQVINRGGTVIRIDFVYDEESANGITHQPTEMKDTV